MFENIFSKLHDRNREIIIMGVWGKDGLELEKKYFSEISGIDMELTGAELADVLSKLDTLKLAPNKYFIKLDFSGHFLFIFSLTPDFFVVMITEQTVVPGRLN
ncbi:MAG: hypothetical protein GY950_07975, partial [bacterium]|nr:hypothetical protein [bacterium]